LRLSQLLIREFSIAEATLMLMLAFVLSAVLGSAQQILFNAQFGAGAEASAFYAALRLRDVFYAVLTGRALASAMIPVLAVERRVGGQHAEWRLVNLVLTSLLCGLTLLVIVCEFAAPVIVSTVLAPGFDTQRSELTVSLIRIVLVQPLILTFACVATAYLNSMQRFFLTSLSIGGHNLGLIAGIAAAHVESNLGIIGPALGVVLGAVLQVSILLPELRSTGLRWRFAWQPGDARLREVGRLLAPTSTSALIGYGALVLDTAFASTAPDTAAVPAVYNAWLLLSLPISLLGRSIGQAVFPHLAKTVVAEDWSNFRRTLLRAIALAVGLALPTALAVLVLGRPLIHVLFERGQFDAAAGTLTYHVLAAYAIGLPFFCGIELAARGMLALRNARMLLLFDVGQLFGRALCMTLFIGRIGVVAVPLAFASMTCLEFVILATLLWVGVDRKAHMFARA
jgi:putative peptidoglycan lipid II flippase